MRASLLGLLLWGVGATATGQTLPGERFDVQTVLDEQRRIAEQAASGTGDYGQVDPVTLQELRDRQRKLAALLRGRQYDQLDERQLALARQHMIWIKYIGQTGGDRLTCERRRTTGSNRVERVCKLAEQRAEENRNSKDQAMRMLQNRTITPCGPGGC